MTYKPQIN